MTTHLEESLQRDFDTIRLLITKMGELGVRTLRDCVIAFRKQYRQLASIIILRDQQLDQLQKRIDRLCLDFLIRHQPVGAHLRFAYVALQINFMLERVGDYAESIARQILKLLDLNCHPSPDLFAEISSAATSMLHNAVDAFARRDAPLAEVTAQIEEQVDTLRNQLNSELMLLVQSNRLPLAALTPLMTIARRFERVSDQAKSICQETLYTCTGEYAKHPGANVYRILFLDDDGGWKSSLAHAIGQSLNRPELAFFSATFNPQAPAPELTQFLKEKGLPQSLSRPSAGAVTTVSLESYQVVIALSAGVKKQLPALGRKTVQFLWQVPEEGGSKEVSRSRLEEAYAYLSKQVTEFVSTLIGDEPTQEYPK